MPSIANTIGADMSTHKVVLKNQFAYGPVTSRNSDKVSVTLLTDSENVIISQAYFVFEIIDENKQMPEYLMMYFCRPEFDRYARLHSHDSAREVFDWEEMSNVMLPVPDIEIQRQIVDPYQTLETRIQNNKKLCTTLEQTAQTLYTQIFVEGIDKEHLPEGWKLGKMSDLIDVRDGTHDSPKTSNEGFALITSQHLLPWSVDIENAYFISEKDYNKINERSLVEQNDILFSMIGTVGLISYVLYEKVEFAVKNMAFSKLLKRRIMQSSFCLP